MIRLFALPLTRSFVMAVALAVAGGPALLLSPLGTASAQPVLVQRDNGNPSRTLPASWLKDFFEESVILEPDGPCDVLEVHVYYSGDTPGLDTLIVAGDPSEGTIAPTGWVWNYNLLMPPVVVEYDGTPGWYTVDISEHGVRSDGFDRIVIQHRVSLAGPYFTADSDRQEKPERSFVMDPFRQNSLGGPGYYALANGDYCVRLLVAYDVPGEGGSADPPAPSLVEVTEQAGLTNGSGNLINSTMASIVDFNNDGRDDVAIRGELFENMGDGTFENVASLQAQSTAWGDFDNDGLIDCFAANDWMNNKLYRNLGNGNFEDVTATSAIVNDHATMTPVWLDYDNDSYLDLFIANNRHTENNQEIYHPDQLWKNNGDGTFTNVTQESGIAAAEPAPYQDCYHASACDYNNDGWVDIFVANYRLGPDFLFRNNGDGTFTDVGRTTGVRGEPTAAPQYFGHGMGCEWADFNNDGYMDVAIGNLGHPDWRGSFSNPSLVYMNDGPPNYAFTEVHEELGIKFNEMNAGMTWGDFDLDGYLDLWHGQISYRAEGDGGEPRRRGHLYMSQGPPDYAMREMTWQYGTHGIHGPWSSVRTDYDWDGDLDLLICSSHVGVRLFRNDLPRAGNWLGVRIAGSPENNIPLDGYGSKVRVYGGGQMFTRELAGGAGGDRNGQQTNELHFGLGSVDALDSVVVTYTNGVSRVLTDLETNNRYFIPYEGAAIVSAPPAPVATDGGWRITGTRYSSGALFFGLRGSEPRDLRVDIYNVLGAHIHSARLDAPMDGLNSIRIPDMRAGAYFVRYTSASGMQTGKFTVVR